MKFIIYFCAVFFYCISSLAMDERPWWGTFTKDEDSEPARKKQKVDSEAPMAENPSFSESDESASGAELSRLSAAVIDDDIECVTAYLDHGDDVNEIDASGMTALDYVFRDTESPTVARALIARGAHVAKLSNVGESYFDMADNLLESASGPYEGEINIKLWKKVKELIINKIDLDKEYPDGKNYLMTVVESQGSVEWLLALMDKIGKRTDALTYMNAKDKNGLTALDYFLSLEFPEPEVLWQMLESGAGCNYKMVVAAKKFDPNELCSNRQQQKMWSAAIARMEHAADIETRKQFVHMQNAITDNGTRHYVLPELWEHIYSYVTPRNMLEVCGEDKWNDLVTAITDSDSVLNRTRVKKDLWDKIRTYLPEGIKWLFHTEYRRDELKPMDLDLD